MSAVDDELHGKRFELLRELLPRARKVPVLWMPDLVVNRNGAKLVGVVFADPAAA